MTLQDTLKQYEDWKFRVSAYDMALSIINIDKLTVAPPAGAAFRDERTAFLAGELFSIQYAEQPPRGTSRASHSRKEQSEAQRQRAIRRTRKQAQSFPLQRQRVRCRASGKTLTI